MILQAIFRASAM